MEDKVCTVAEIAGIVEKFAPPELAEPWDCVGWAVGVNDKVIRKVMLALTVTDDVVRQARKASADMILSHHPLFVVPLDYADMPIFCAHTNLDKTCGGTTDTLVSVLGLKSAGGEDFIRYVDIDTTVDAFATRLKKITNNLRVVNKGKVRDLKRIAFCAGNGSDFIAQVQAGGADAFVTGDLKFHNALESKIVLFDIGHFESEVPVLKVLADLLPVETVFANEESPFLTC